MKSLCRPTILFFALIFVASTLRAQEDDDRRDRADAYVRNAVEAYADEQYGSAAALLEDALGMRPNHPAIQYHLADAYARAGQQQRALEVLAAIARSGFFFDLRNNASFRDLLTLKKFDSVAERMQRNLFLIESSSLVRQVARTELLATSLAVDAEQERFFVGLGDRPSLLVLSQGATPEQFFLEEPADYGVSALSYDAKENALWICLLPDQAKAPRSAAERGGPARILRFSLQETAVVSSWSMPKASQPREITAIAIDDDASLFLCDRANREILHFAPETGQFDIWASGPFGAPCSLALLADGGPLALADADFGLWLIDRHSAEPVLVELPEDVSFYGVNSLTRRGEELIVAQHSLPPTRILAVKLDIEAARVTSVRVLEQAHMAYEDPTALVTDADGGVFFLTRMASSLNAFEPNEEAVEPSKTFIRRLDR